MNPDAVFELSDVTYRYAEATALDGVTLSIAKGERVAVLGANGSGKSTLLRVLGGLSFAQHGNVAFRGKPLTAENLNGATFAEDFRRRVGVIFQNSDAQLFNATVFDEVAFGPMQLGGSKDEIIQQVHAALNDMEILHLKDRPPHRLSGGEKKRVALASVLVLDPEVLLMDEPTAALDPKSQAHMIDFLFGCKGRKTVVTATHHLDIVEEIADSCVVLDNGRVAASGPSVEILRDLPLLEHTHLIHAHRHRHGSGIVHSHPHLHRAHDHTHPHE
jgi:cobalt/nickel transport system ATP-binding protein